LAEDQTVFVGEGRRALFAIVVGINVGLPSLFFHRARLLIYGVHTLTGLIED
jgi:hypothetical protein